MFANGTPHRLLSVALLALSVGFVTGCGDDTSPSVDTDSGTDVVDSDTPVDSGDDADVSDPSDTSDSGVDTGTDATDVSADDADGEPDGVSDAGPDSFFDPDVDEDDDADGPEATLPILESVEPAEGPAAGGTLVLAFGRGFTPDTQVVLNGRAVTGVDYVDDTTLLFFTPPSAPGTYDIKVANSAGETSLTGAFTFLAALSATDLAPDRGPVRGGIPVVLTGTGFDEGTRVAIGGRSAADIAILSSTQIRFIAPPGVEGTADVQVTGTGGTRILNDGFAYFAEPDLLSVRPGAGPVAGGNTVTLSGTGFDGVETVYFDEQVARITGTNLASEPQTLDVVAPPGAQGVVPVTVVPAEGAADTLDGAYVYVGVSAEPQIVAVAPAFGPQSGGTTVTIGVSGLGDAEVQSVTFDGAEATVVDSDEWSVTVTTPAGSVGPANVQMTFDSGAPVVRNNAYEYLANVDIVSVTPSVGPAAGGTIVTVNGTGFDSATTVEIGGVLASDVRIASATRLTAVTPTGIPGAADVAVANRVSDDVLTGGFTYESELLLSSFSPDRGAIAGNTYVVLRGEGFTPDTGVRFDSVDALEVAFIDAFTLAVRTPPGEAGAVKVEVVRGEEVFSARPRFTYYDPWSDAGGWWGGPINGSVNVTVANAMTGARVPDAFVTLHLRAADASFTGITNENGQVTISDPAIRGAQTITAIAPAFSASTVTRVDAENVVIYLNPIVPPSPGEPPPGDPWAIIQGNLSGLDKITDPGPDEILIAVIRTSTPSPGGRNPPGTGITQVEYVGGVDVYPYTMDSRFGDQAIVALCGTFNLVTEEFTPLYMGLRRGIVGRSGETYDVDLECDIPLDESIAFKFVNPPLAPGGPEINRAIPFLDFGSEGGIDLLTLAEGTESIITGSRFVDLSEPQLSGVRYFMVGQVEPVDGGIPFAVNYVRGLTDTSALVVFDPFLPPANLIYPAAPARRLVERRFEWSLATDVPADFYFAFITDLAQETTYWEVYLPGDESGFNLPFFPPDVTTPGLPPGEQLILFVFSIDAITFDYDAFDLNDFSANNWRAYSANGWVFEN
jgi:hypothetical protein